MLNQKGFSPILLAVATLAVLILAGSYFYINNYSSKRNQETDRSNIQQINPTSPPLDLKLYKDGIQSFEIQIPSKMDISTYSNYILIKSPDEIRSNFEKAKKDDQCAGPCSIFANDKKLLEKQFEILEKVSKLNDCNFTSEFNSEIYKSFGLFAGGIEHKVSVEGIYNPNLGVCGIKFIAADGYDVSITNFVYKAGFLKDDKVIRIEFKLFNTKLFAEVDKMLKGFGEVDGGCDASCYEKESKYFEELLQDSQKLDQPPLKEVVETYDKAVKSFKLAAVTKKAADSQNPTSGICQGPTTEQLVTLIFGEDNVAYPKCMKVIASQKLQIINSSKQALEVSFKNYYKISVPVNENRTIDSEFGSYLMPGVHQLLGSELWLQ